MEHILSILIFFPAFAALIGFLVKDDSIRIYGIVVTAIEFVLSLLLWSNFDSTVAGMQFLETIPMISAYGINYIVGIDGISLFLVIMTTFMTMISIIGLSEKRKFKAFINHCVIFRNDYGGGIFSFRCNYFSTYSGNYPLFNALYNWSLGGNLRNLCSD